MKTYSEPTVVHQSVGENGKLNSALRYVFPVDKTNGVLIPKWLLVTASLIATSVLITLVAAIVVVVLAPRNALYLENCAGRSCIPNFGLKCINKTCQCTTGYIYINKCTSKINYMEKCLSLNNCMDSANLVCLNGVCMCNSTAYWNNKKSTCINKGNISAACSSNDQCLGNLMITCNIQQGICGCDSTRLVKILNYFSKYF